MTDSEYDAKGSNESIQSFSPFRALFRVTTKWKWNQSRLDTIEHKEQFNQLLQLNERRSKRRNEYRQVEIAFVCYKKANHEEYNGAYAIFFFSTRVRVYVTVL